ncbi:MAG: hypothetical protein IH986_06860 [Planctomycetes bacterium]|nr:hypothetical protein [Planctomycetota bacterium]
MMTAMRLLLLTISLAAACRAEIAQDSPAAAPTPKSEELTVAILDFAANTPGQPELGKQIGDVLTVMLSSQAGFRLVDRAVLSRTLQEQELNLSGVVETSQAIKIGKLVGARILVVGKAFALGKQLMITAKLIGTETSLVDGVIAKGPLDADVGELLMELSQKVAERLRTAGLRLVAQDDATLDPLPALKKALAGRKKPVIAVVIMEEHITRRRAAVPDPAVETEFKLLLRECGFEIRDVPQNELVGFVGAGKKDGFTWPRGLGGVDVVIVGKAYSEFAARIGNLISCTARAEINVISRSSGKIVMADRSTDRAVDLSENIAGKKALQKSGRVLGLRVLEYFEKNLPPTGAGT